MEIEKKYLIRRLPENLEQYECKRIAQGYLCTAPVVRIKEAYEHLLPKIDGLLISKTRFLIPLSDGLTAELDIFDGELAGLTMVEVEFTTIEQADQFIPPEWFGEDVTNSGKYHNSYLSQHGLH